MVTLNTKELAVPALQGYLSNIIAPRPIAFVSTVDKDGKPNLSPFSFFNVFSTNPPIVVFSPARSGRNNTTKHTHDNLREVPEAVINVVTYDMVHQTSLSSTEYPKGTNEFIKAGFTELPSAHVKPPRVKESPVQMECVVKEIVELGQSAGAGNLVICEIILIHISESVLNTSNHIDQQKLDLVGRAGNNWYVRASGAALFEVAKPILQKGIGVDAIPVEIRNSSILTRNHLGQLGNVEHLPSPAEIEDFTDKELKFIFTKFTGNVLNEQLHLKAKQFLDEGKVAEAWKTLLASN